MSDRSSRTERPTPRRLQRAREKGEVAKSREVISALTFACAALLFYSSGSSFLRSSGEVVAELLSLAPPSEMTADHVRMLAMRGALGVIKLAGPVLLLTLAVAICGGLAQTGFLFSLAQLAINFERLNPAQNLSRIFSLGGIVELVKSLLVFGLIAYLSADVVAEHIGCFPAMTVMPLRETLKNFGAIAWQILARIAIFLFALAIGDYLYQRYQFQSNMRMTKQEIKEEMRETEGDALLRGRIRRRQRDLVHRMMAAVRKADVVVTNPTHYAVALSYKIGQMAAPQVVAKGKGFLARKIREVAEQNRIPIVENPSLAQALYKSVQVGQQIPVSLYKAVAEILAYVYKARASRL